MLKKKEQKRIYKIRTADYNKQTVAVETSTIEEISKANQAAEMANHPEENKQQLEIVTVKECDCEQKPTAQEQNISNESDVDYNMIVNEDTAIQQNKISADNTVT